MSIDVEKVWTDINAMLETSQAKDARIAELERELAGLKADRDHYQSENVRLERELAARPVVEGEAAWKLRHFLLEHSAQRLEFARSWEHGYKLVSLLYRLRDSAPPEALPVREVVVEPPEARKLRESWGKLSADTQDVITENWSTVAGLEFGVAFRAFCGSAPPASAASDARARILTEQLNELAKSHAVEGERWSREMGEKDAEVYTLRATLAAVNNQYDERMAQLLDVNNQYDERMAQLSEYQDRAMKEVNELLCAARAWLAAPLAQHSEYVRAAVEYAEAHVRAVDAPSNRLLEEAGVAYVAFRSLYDARKRGSAKENTNVPVAQSEEHAGSNGVVAGSSPAGDTNQAPATASSEFTTWLPDGPPAPAMKAHGGAHFNPPPAERVTLYVLWGSDGSVSELLGSREGVKLSPTGTLLALDARVVEKGGSS